MTYLEASNVIAQSRCHKVDPMKKIFIISIISLILIFGCIGSPPSTPPVPGTRGTTNGDGTEPYVPPTPPSPPPATCPTACGSDYTQEAYPDCACVCSRTCTAPELLDSASCTCYTPTPATPPPIPTCTTSCGSGYTQGAYPDCACYCTRTCTAPELLNTTNCACYTPATPPTAPPTAPPTTNVTIPPIRIVNITPAVERVYGPGIYYFNPGAGSFIIEIDGIVASVYDQVGVMLRSGESADVKNATSLFIGDFPAHSPRDMIIKTRVTRTRELANWREDVAQGRLTRKNMAIVILNERRSEIRRIVYSNAWPSEYRLDLDSATLEETVTIVSESVRSG